MKDLRDNPFDEDKIIKAHEFLKQFITLFDKAKRGGIHDFMELSISNMINESIKRMEDYLSHGHINIDGRELMVITVDAFQKVLDDLKYRLDKIKQVGMN